MIRNPKKAYDLTAGTWKLLGRRLENKLKPIGSMYGIIDYIYHENQPTVGRKWFFGDIRSRSETSLPEVFFPGEVYNICKPEIFIAKWKGNQFQPKPVNWGSSR